MRSPESGIKKGTGGFPALIAHKGRVVVAGIAFSAVMISGCTSPPTDGLSTPSYGLVEANLPDLLYVAVYEIQNRCQDLGDALMAMYLNNQLDWGSEEPYGEATIGYAGTITMNATSYYDPRNPDPIEMLIADLFHEAAHALNNENDGPPANNDPWSRPYLNSTSFDANYLDGTCPTLPPPA